MDMEDICEQAISVAGGPSGLASQLGGITPQAVSQWKRVPPGRVLAVAHITGISPHELRPDIYGPAPKRETAA